MKGETVKNATGFSDRKLSKANSVIIESVHFWPYVGKAKLRLRGDKFLENCKQTAVNCWQLKLKKLTASQTHFGFTNIGSKVHRFSSTAICFWQFSIGIPCKS